ncbi:MAG TPA: hypothetical protein VGA69_11850 [Nitriliruptorales bacterium]
MPALYGVLSLVLVAGALTFALSSPPPSTPPLAEVAPAPQEQVEVERVEQSSQFGAGQGGEADCVAGDVGCEGASVGTAAGTSAPPEPTADPDASHATSRPCYGVAGARTQTSDPQSPACLPTVFEGDNSGVTWTGVTRDAVRIAVPWPPLEPEWITNEGDTDVNARRALQAFVRHFEQYYELYGRSLELVPVPRPQAGGPEVERAYAVEIAETVAPFAVLHYISGSEPFYRELAARGVVAIDIGSAPMMTTTYAALHPHVWGLYPAVEQALEATGRLVCGALAGHPASHGGPDVSGTPRRFGVVVQRWPGRTTEARALLARLEACGADHLVYDVDRDADVDLLIQRLQADEVTTVTCVCVQSVGWLAKAADEAGYEPELLTHGLGDHASPSRAHKITSRAQRGHVFGLEPGLRQVSQSVGGRTSLEEQYWYQAATEQDPDLRFDRSSLARIESAYAYYAQLLVLSSGIQAAGPELTPEAFGTGLERQAFPSRGAGQAPWWQPSVGFGPGDHTFNSDFALTWWQLSSEAEEQARRYPGSYCYVGDGQRFGADTLPPGADTMFFDPEAGCR